MKRNNKIFCLILAIMTVISISGTTLANVPLLGIGTVQRFNFAIICEPESNINSIIYGGVYLEYGTDRYYSNDSQFLKLKDDSSYELIYDMPVRNLNYHSPYIYCTCYDDANDTSKILRFNPDSESGFETVLSVESRIKQMYIVKQNNAYYILYLIGNTIHARHISLSLLTSNLQLQRDDVFGFMPTDNGMICYDVEYENYTLYNQDASVVAAENVRALHVNQSEQTVECYKDNVPSYSSFSSVAQATGYVTLQEKEVELVDIDELLEELENSEAIEDVLDDDDYDAESTTPNYRMKKNMRLRNSYMMKLTKKH